MFLYVLMHSGHDRTAGFEPNDSQQSPPLISPCIIFFFYLLMLFPNNRTPPHSQKDF